MSSSPSAKGWAGLRFSNKLEQLRFSHLIIFLFPRWPIARRALTDVSDACAPLPNPGVGVQGWALQSPGFAGARSGNFFLGGDPGLVSRLWWEDPSLSSVG
ncbi:hypothetical protein CDAR_172571 [Caerostris darwini]|uniref:Uncharacterized protein n=1 Tax=Caerostris darwini TaxID=1538125 RepID=A0AAV4MEC1_9ARAC|nr:hypothetical protein CDAR_172571 [Caerostris darwini]